MKISKSQLETLSSHNFFFSHTGIRRWTQPIFRLVLQFQPSRLLLISLKCQTKISFRGAYLLPQLTYLSFCVSPPFLGFLASFLILKWLLWNGICLGVYKALLFISMVVPCVCDLFMTWSLKCWCVVVVH